MNSIKIRGLSDTDPYDDIDLKYESAALVEGNLSEALIVRPAGHLGRDLILLDRGDQVEVHIGSLREAVESQDRRPGRWIIRFDPAVRGLVLVSPMRQTQSINRPHRYCLSTWSYLTDLATRKFGGNLALAMSRSEMDPLSATESGEYAVSAILTKVFTTSGTIRNWIHSRASPSLSHSQAS